ncbi:MAG: DinB family protein [Chitinophagales bacterium]
MKATNEVLIEDLMDRTKGVLNEANLFLQIEPEGLNWKASEKEWSILECIEHLNRYGDFYLPEITQRIAAASKKEGNMVFKSGLLGNYFAKGMLPKEKLNKMNTFKSMNPSGSQLDKSTLEKFINQQKQMLDLLQQARNIDLNKTKTSISISTLIKLKLGDTFRVVIYHNQRHIVQANKVKEKRG